MAQKTAQSMTAQSSTAYGPYKPPTAVHGRDQLDESSMFCRTAVSAMDLSTYILASFATVEEVRKAVDPASFSVVNFHLSEPAMAILKEAGLIAPQGHPFIHLGINDAKHDSLVIEFIEGGPLPAYLPALINPRRALFDPTLAHRHISAIAAQLS